PAPPSSCSTAVAVCRASRRDFPASSWPRSKPDARLLRQSPRNAGAFCYGCVLRGGAEAPGRQDVASRFRAGLILALERRLEQPDLTIERGRGRLLLGHRGMDGGVEPAHLVVQHARAR